MRALFNYSNPAQQGIINTAKALLRGKKICDHIITTAIEQYAFFCDRLKKKIYFCER